VAYAVVWVAFWVWLRVIWEASPGSSAARRNGRHPRPGFDAPRAIPQVIAALFVLHTFGYYVGGWIAGKLVIDHPLAAMLIWAVWYGIGFGAGLGVAFYLCQETSSRLAPPDRSKYLVNASGRPPFGDYFR